MNSRLKRRIYRGIVHTEDQIRAFAERFTKATKERMYRGVAYVESSTNKEKVKRQLMWRGNSYLG